MIRTAMILVLSLVLPAAASAAPARLTDVQMDLVTAGLTVDSRAAAFASGNDARGNASAANRVFSGRFFTIGVGAARADASACCGDEAAVATAAAATGDGDIVRSRGYSFEYETGSGQKVSRSGAFVLVIEFNRGLLASR